MGFGCLIGALFGISGKRSGHRMLLNETESRQVAQHLFPLAGGASPDIYNAALRDLLAFG